MSSSADSGTAMSVQIICPKCDRSCPVKEELLGRRVRCPGCQEIFRAERAPPKVAPIIEPLPELEPGAAAEFWKDEQPADSVVKPGALLNPFEQAGASPLAPSQVDTSAFDFDAGDPSDGADLDFDDGGPARTTDKKKARLTRKHYGHRPHDTLDPAESFPVPKAVAPEVKRPSAPARGADAPETPFGFATAELVSVKRRPDSHHDAKVEHPAQKPKRSTARTSPVKGEEDDASLLGLENLDQTPATSSKKQEHLVAGFSPLDAKEQQLPLPARSKPKKAKPPRQYFHVRQSGFWGRDAHLFRVFVQDGELVLVTAAAGKEVGQTEETLQSGSPDNCERKIRERLAELDQEPVDELAENDRHSSRLSAEKIKTASIDMPPFGLLHKRGSAILRLEHKSKGALTFDIPSDADVDRAIEYLPGVLDQVLRVNVRWDKAKKAFTAR
jgi:hypothetical protein